jgi:hypothetical protein
VFVLHAFQKKSKSGIATPKPEIELIKQRLKRAIEIAKRRTRPMADPMASCAIIRTESPSQLVRWVHIANRQRSVPRMGAGMVFFLGFAS